MAKTLTAKTTKLSWLLRTADQVPPSMIGDSQRYSLFRRVLKKVLHEYNEEMTKMVDEHKASVKDEESEHNKHATIFNDKEVSKKDKSNAEVEMKRLGEILQKKTEDINKKLQAYAKANDKDTKVVFDNEAYNYMNDLFSKTANIIFGNYHKDKDGNVINESCDTNAIDTLFELLESAR